MNKDIIGRLIFAKVLEMNIGGYTDYVKSFIAGTSRNPFYRVHHIDKRISSTIPSGATGAIIAEENEIRFYSPEYVKLNFHLTEEPKDVRWKHRMNWIRTKNLFLHHVVNNVIVIQKNFWDTQELKTLVPISLKEFLEEHPFPYLDISRLSRLLNNTWIYFKRQMYLLRDFFWSAKKVHARILEGIVSQQANAMKDREMQVLFKIKHGIEVSVRTICNYRNSVSIPAYNKDELHNPYNHFFSSTQKLNKKSISLIPEEAGVYEISANREIKYKKSASSVIYYGRSKNLRRRIRSYLYRNCKNPLINRYRNRGLLIVRHYCTSEHFQIEKELLGKFVLKFGSPPIANRLSNGK